MSRARVAATVLAFALFQGAVWAESCKDFKWDTTREQALFAEKPTAVGAGTDAAAAPGLKTETLYDVALVPQEQVRFAVPVGKKMIPDGASAGLLRFRVPQAGTYRIAVSQAFWVDVVNGDRAIPSLDFGGSHGCDRPRKIVVYELPADQDLTLQLSGQVETHVLLSITAASGKS